MINFLFVKIENTLKCVIQPSKVVYGKPGFGLSVVNTQETGLVDF